MNTQTAGNSMLTVNANGVFNYPWKPLAEWAGTCREVVVRVTTASSTARSSGSVRGWEGERPATGAPPSPSAAG